MAADGVSHAGWQAVLWWNLFSAERWIWASQLQAGAVEHCQRLPGKEWRCGRAGEDAGKRDCASGIVRGAQRAGFGEHSRGDSEVCFWHVRCAAWRVWAGAEVSASFGFGFADRAVCEEGQSRRPGRKR